MAQINIHLSGGAAHPCTQSDIKASAYDHRFLHFLENTCGECVSSKTAGQSMGTISSSAPVHLCGFVEHRAMHCSTGQMSVAP